MAKPFKDAKSGNYFVSSTFKGKRRRRSSRQGLAPVPSASPCLLGED